MDVDQIYQLIETVVFPALAFIVAITPTDKDNGALDRAKNIFRLYGRTIVRLFKK